MKRQEAGSEKIRTIAQALKIMPDKTVRRPWIWKNTIR
jgi:hypothetical protein